MEPEEVKQDIEAARDEDSDTEAQSLIDRLHGYRKYWEEQCGQRQEAVESDKKGRLYSGRQDYDDAMKKLKEGKGTLKISRRHLLRRKDNLAQGKPTVHRTGIPRVQGGAEEQKLVIAREIQDNARDRLRNEIEQTACVVYKFRQLEDPAGSPSEGEDVENGTRVNKVEDRQRRYTARARLLNEIDQAAGVVHKCRQQDAHGGSPSEGGGYDKERTNTAINSHMRYSARVRWCNEIKQTAGVIHKYRQLGARRGGGNEGEDNEKEMKHLEVSTKNIEDQEEEVQRQTLALVKLLKTSEDPHIEEGQGPGTPTRSHHCLALPIVVLLAIGLGIGLAAGCTEPAVESLDHEDVASHPVFVVPIYTLLVIPIGLYLTHDLIDKRWRPVLGPVRSIHGWARLYCLLSFIGLSLLTSYAYVQFNAGAMDEGMAAAVSCSVAIYGGYIYMRQRAVLKFFTETLQNTAKRVRVLGVQRDWQRGKPHVDREIIVDHLNPEDLESLFPGGSCYGKLSSALLDDNFPGDGPRVTWLSPDPEVVDKLELIARVGLWILLAVKPPMYVFAEKLRPNLGFSVLGTAVDPSSTNALWTIDLARLLFRSLPRTRSSNGGAGSGDSKYFLSDFRALVEGATMFEWKGVTKWVKPLSLIPTSEWAQALAEHSSGEVVDLLETTVAWEILLSLCSPQMKVETGSEEALINRLKRVIQQFGVFGVVDVSRLSKNNRLELLEFEVLAKKWSLLISQCFEAYKPHGVSSKQLQLQAERAEALDMLIAATLMLGVVPARHLELDCKFYLTANNSTLLLEEREKHVVSLLWGIAQKNEIPASDSM